MYDFANFTDTDLASCGDTLRGVGSGASSMEDAANRLVKTLYENITDSATGQTANALVRFYKTHPYDQLDAGLQEFARGLLGSNPPRDDLHCLGVLGTVADIVEANSRAESKIHQAIPLASAEMVSGIPIIGPLVNQFGIDVGAVMRPDPMLIGDLSRKTFNTFYVPEAVGSPHMGRSKSIYSQQYRRDLQGNGQIRRGICDPIWHQVAAGFRWCAILRGTLLRPYVLQSIYSQQYRGDLQGNGRIRKGCHGALCGKQGLRLMLGPQLRIIRYDDGETWRLTMSAMGYTIFAMKTLDSIWAISD